MTDAGLGPWSTTRPASPAHAVVGRAPAAFFGDPPWGLRAPTPSDPMAHRRASRSAIETGHPRSSVLAYESGPTVYAGSHAAWVPRTTSTRRRPEGELLRAVFGSRSHLMLLSLRPSRAAAGVNRPSSVGGPSAVPGGRPAGPYKPGTRRARPSNWAPRNVRNRTGSTVLADPNTNERDGTWTWRWTLF